MSKFKTHYQTFLENSIKHEKYKITFEDDSELICTPFCGSFVNQDDESEFSIAFEDIEGTRRTAKKTFSSIKKIEKVVG